MFCRRKKNFFANEIFLQELTSFGSHRFAKKTFRRGNFFNYFVRICDRDNSDSTFNIIKLYGTIKIVATISRGIQEQFSSGFLPLADSSCIFSFRCTCFVNFMNVLYCGKDGRDF